MDLKAVIGFVLATAFIASGIYADYRARKLRVTGELPHLPNFEWWPVPAMPVKIMAMLLVAIASVGVMFSEMGIVAPNPAKVSAQISFNSFVCLGLIGLACLTSWRGVVSQTFGGMALIWSSLTTADAFHHIGVCDLLHAASDPSDNEVAPIAGACFIIGSLIALLLGRAYGNRALRYAAGFLGVMLFFYGALALLGYATGNTVVLSFNGMKSVPAATAFLILIMGSGFSSLIYHDHVQEWTKDELSTAVNTLTALTILGASLTAIHVFLTPMEDDGVGVLLILGIVLVCTGAVGFVSLRRALTDVRADAT